MLGTTPPPEVSETPTATAVTVTAIGVENTTLNQTFTPDLKRKQKGGIGGMDDHAQRKRSTRACDGCKEKRLKCEDIQLDNIGLDCCKLCREAGERCSFTVPVRKRGPIPGSSRKKPKTAAPSSSQNGASTSTPRLVPGQPSTTRTHHLAVNVTGPDGSLATSRTPSRSLTPPTRSASMTRGGSTRPALLGLPRGAVDDLLAIYFTHVHNVWPLVYKPLFHLHTASSPLLLAMISIAACIDPSVLRDGLDGDKLFHMAERSLHHCRMESRIDMVQAMILLSLRQTGCGDKGSAFLYAGRACTMSLNLGLNLAPKKTGAESEAEEELRSRVYWNCYVLDKTLAEETGRSFLLPYRRSSTPFPSLTETDEFESWPPLSMTSAPLPRSVRHIVPRRGYVLSCFVWTCRLGMIVEDILDLDVIGPPISDPYDQQFASNNKGREKVKDAEEIAEQLRVWKASLPKYLDVNPSGPVSPLPHHVIGMTWWWTARILLYSRFVQRRTIGSSPLASMGNIAAQAHQVCSEGAKATVEMLDHLERHKLLRQLSSDVIHILSLATLFQAFDASDPDPGVSLNAKRDFDRCCSWLKDFSSSWPAASAHKLFLEAVIQGGSQLSTNQLPGPSQSPRNSVASSLDVTSSSHPQGLERVQRNLHNNETSTPEGAGPGAMLQLPQYYWNHLTAGTASLGPPLPFYNEPNTQNWSSQMDLIPLHPASLPTPGPGIWTNPAMVDSTPTGNTDLGPQMNNIDSALNGTGTVGGGGMDSIFPDSFTDSVDWNTFDWGAASSAPQASSDPAAISAALMSFMANAAKGR